MLVPCHSPDQPHIARRDGGSAYRVDPVSGAVRQSVRPGRRICEEFSFVDARAPSACRLHEGARRLGREGSGHRPSAPKASAVERRPRLLNTDVPEPEGVSSASHADTGPRDHCRRARGGPGAVEHADRPRAPARDDDLRGLPGPLPRRFGARLARGGGICRRRAAGRGAGALDRMGRRRAPGPSSARRVPEPFPDPSVGALPAPGQPRARRILRRLPGDFEERYGFRPYLVESFADEGYNGTCLRAANFLCVGRTAGRGRQDREQRRAQTVKRASEPNHCTLTTVTRLSARTPRTAALARRSSSFMLSSCSFIASVESGLLREIIRHLHDADVRSEHDSHGKMTVRHGQAFGQ